MQDFNLNLKAFIDPSLDKLLFVLSTLAIILVSPFLVWNDQLLIFRIVYFLGIFIGFYIFIRYHDSTLYNTSLVLFFFLVSLYTMVVGTENNHLTYIPFLALIYISLKPIEHLRVFDYFTTILAVIYSLGLLSYFMEILGLNVSIGTAIAPNPTKSPYLVYFGHIEETDLPIYRFSSIFDEPGVVGTLNGLILASIGISKQNIKSIILLLAGLISFSLAFYIILAIILIKNLNLTYIIIVFSLLTMVWFLQGEKMDYLIVNRVVHGNENLEVGNRTGDAFDEYYDIFVAKGGNSLIFGKGSGTYRMEAEEGMTPSSYKTLIIDNGIVGVALIVCFFALCVYYLNNSKKGWFLFFIFIISGYQRPDLMTFYIIVMFLGGLNYLKFNIANTENKSISKNNLKNSKSMSPVRMSKNLQ